MRNWLLAIITYFIGCSSSMAQAVSTYAGSQFGFQDGSASVARFNQPTGICVDGSGTVYVVDAGNSKIRKITTNGEVSTFAGSTEGYLDGTGTAAQFNYIRGICADAAGNLYVTESVRIRKITPQGVVTTLAGSTTTDAGYQDGTGTDARFFGVMGICIDGNGNLYVADSSNNKIRKITPQGVVTTFFDGYTLFLSIHDICINTLTGALFVTDRYGQKVYRITATGVISVFAGSTMGYVEGMGTAAQLNFPHCITIDAAGNLYVTDNTYLIRKITPARVVSTLAGGPGGEVDGIGLAARFGNLEGICVNAQGIIYVADTQHMKIKRVTTTLGVSEYESAVTSLKIYPNPAKTTLTFAITNYTEGMQIDIIDVSGKTLYTEKTTSLNTTFDTSSLSKGIYFARISHDATAITEKFIVE